MKRLYLDIETSPNVGFFWSAGYKVDISYNQILEERRIITAAYKWENEDKIRALTWDKNRYDKKLVKNITDVMNQSDEIVAHFGSGFDLPWVRTRALFHGIVVPIWKEVDTCSWAKRYFFLNSYKLDYLADYLGIGTKIRTEYDLWKDATMGTDKVSKQAVDQMVEYNKHDVELLEQVFNKLSLYCPSHTHVGVLEGGEKWSCPRCGTEHVWHVRPIVNNSGTVRQHMRCADKNCGKYYIISNASYKAFLKGK